MGWRRVEVSQQPGYLRLEGYTPRIDVLLSQAEASARLVGWMLKAFINGTASKNVQQ